MARPLRIEYPGALYHLTSRGNERKAIFLDSADRVRFLSILEDYHERYGILIHCYVLMDNHYHLLMETPKGNLLKIMHGLNSGYTGYFNKKYNRSGHLFQGRYKGILVEKESYLIELSRYIHLNPVRAGIVEKPELYKWSSYPAYIGKDKEQQWVEYSWILSGFGKNKKRARTKYRKFVDSPVKVNETPLREVHGQVMLGTDGFIKKVQKLILGKGIGNDITERKRLIGSPGSDEILNLMAKAFNSSIEEITGKGVRLPARKIAIYLMQRYSNLSISEIAEVFGGIHFSAVSKTSSRLKGEMSADKKLARIVQELESKIIA